MSATKLFLIVLAAILTAVAVIGSVVVVVSVAAARNRAYAEWAVDTEDCSKRISIIKQQIAYPGYADIVETLKARLRDEQEHLVLRLKYKPGSSLTPDEQRMLDSTQAELTRRTATLTTEVQPQDGSALIPAGTEVELLSQDASNAHIRYAGRQYTVWSSAVQPK